MMKPIDVILQRFEQLSAVPRGTKNEAGIRLWLQDWAEEHVLSSKVDKAGNLVIYVPATKGLERQPTLILQGHLDMVCQKTPDSSHDFTRDPIHCIRSGDWLKADHTTLGADNGIAIALMMALVEDDTVSHPALELLLTVEEEIGPGGADALDPELITGKTMINLDSEDEGVFVAGSAGGRTTYIHLPASWEPVAGDEVTFHLQVSGLRGGHSGGDIHKQRANANKLLARVLDQLSRSAALRMVSWKGGTARNAIPREAEAVFICVKDSVAKCRELTSIFEKTLHSEYSISDPGLSLSLTEADRVVQAVSVEDSLIMVQLVMALPNGVSDMSAAYEGLVETSSNIGIIDMDGDGFHITSNQRSSILSRLDEICVRVESIARLSGARFEHTAGSAPWQPNMESPVLLRLGGLYESLFGSSPKIEVIHGGLECGIISGRCKGLDTISLGPTIINAHSPDESLFIPSVSKVWSLLTGMLKLP
jgi:dipeptidase D